MAQKRKADSKTVGVNLQLDKELVAVLEVMAKRAHQSKKWYIVSIIEKHLEQEREGREPIEVNADDASLKSERLEAHG